jgi:hypothetical protein
VEFSEVSLLLLATHTVHIYTEVGLWAKLSLTHKHYTHTAQTIQQNISPMHILPRILVVSALHVRPRFGSV